jgi:hypothetical protein
MTHLKLISAEISLLYRQVQCLASQVEVNPSLLLRSSERGYLLLDIYPDIL